MAETDVMISRPRGPFGAFAARKKSEILQRRAQVAQLFLRKTPVGKIAEALKVTQGTISGDLKALRVVWKEEAVRDIKEHQAQLVAELDIIINECTTHLHDKTRDRSLDSVWITQWRVTLLERAKVLGLLDNHIDVPGGSRIGIREVVIELPPGNE
jgi:DNA-binding transcriptional ArsR family regulator